MNEAEQTNQNKFTIGEAVEISLNTLADAVEKDKWTAELEFTEYKKKVKEQSRTGNFFQGKKILITAGPTYEKIDDVRYISNFSSGKMGFALAEEASKLGAEVILIAGPVHLNTPHNVNRINVESAEDMYIAAMKHFPDIDIAILAAAVADYTPEIKFEGKIKKQEAGENLILTLKSTKDILKSLGKIKSINQVLVGFALESSNEIENGWKKLQDKNCDIIVVNNANKPQSGFRGDNNTITILTGKVKQFSYPPMSKTRCAVAIFEAIFEFNLGQ